MKAKEDYANEKLSIEGTKGTSQTIPIFPTPYLFESTHAHDRDPNRKRPQERKPIVRPMPARLDDDEEIIFVEDDCEILEEVERTLEQIN